MPAPKPEKQFLWQAQKYLPGPRPPPRTKHLLNASQTPESMIIEPAPAEADHEPYNAGALTTGPRRSKRVFYICKDFFIRPCTQAVLGRPLGGEPSGRACPFLFCIPLPPREKMTERCLAKHEWWPHVRKFKRHLFPAKPAANLSLDVTGREGNPVEWDSSC